jgi:heptosyltransferase-2
MPGVNEELEQRGGGSGKPKRLLVVCPSWLGDVVMATPALRLLRDRLPGAFIGGLLRPGMDELLAGTSLLDEMHVDRARGVMGPKMVAAKVRPRMYDTALLLTNSFSTALITRLAFIPRRVGYDREGRGLLLTQRLRAERRGALAGLGVGSFACVPAVEYYLHAARAIVGEEDAVGDARARLELGYTEKQMQAGEWILKSAGVNEGDAFAVLNPGGNDPAKRWPADRFIEIGKRLQRERGWKVLVNGSPGEAELCERLAVGLGDKKLNLQEHVITIGALKPLLERARLMVTNDTGPRHIAAAFGVPTVALFGPTDHRWTTLPESGAPMIEVLADPTLPEDQLANDHPERCAIDKIEVERVWGAVQRALASRVQ